MKKLVIVLVFIFGIIGLKQLPVQANESNNLPIDEVKEKITNIAQQYDIPPEILKAIAFIETGYKQFQEDGSPIVSNDGGIGMMQVTPGKIDIEVDEEKLKTDLTYNIEIAAQVLIAKWNLSYLPEMNDQDRTVLENWYFAIMAYNGLSKQNDPNENPDEAYQERVYDRMEGSSLIYWNDHHFDFPTFDIRYEDNSNSMKFAEGKHYTTETQTPSQQLFEQGDLVYIDERDGSVSLRSAVTEGNVVTKLWPYTPLTIVDAPTESPSMDNDFVYYPVEGVTVEGFVASAYLNQGKESMVFSDAGDDRRAAALGFVALNDFANGYPGGSFGSHDPLKREHVAVILDNTLQLTMPSDYEMKADDVDPGNAYIEQLAKAEFNGLLGGGGKLRPKEFLTRAQMAQVMSDAFEDYFEKPTSTHTFKDQEHIWNPEAVNLIYHNNVTVADPFHPNIDITRSQFAIFLYRTMVDF
ncbi:S-layer homology domain-containing protein [Aquibacillus albus]|uniref:SLH domain-containing protein n=1 Tax=Aquibacillus albus TaxID=1168171 RepID=A0ABS2MX34_9BACI|nr:S-layer homology domain-containing protein [Aquibacillus albus]MBM7570439.1 hypothetical protein [Aquibacillus albus]